MSFTHIIIDDSQFMHPYITIFSLALPNKTIYSFAPSTDGTGLIQINAEPSTFTKEYLVSDRWLLF
jgi:hypothetical protein